MVRSAGLERLAPKRLQPAPRQAPDARGTKQKTQQSQVARASAQNEALIIAAHQDYLSAAQAYLDKARQTLVLIEAQALVDAFERVRKVEIEGFMVHADRQIDQVRRRVILGEAIPHGEKVFSIFQPHTEWISQGKAGVAVELGVKVCIVED